MIQKIKEFTLNKAYSQSFENQKRQFQVLKHFDGREQLHLIQLPTLISYANEDLVSLPYESEFMHQQNPGSELYMWKGGHNHFFESPKLLAHKFTQFFLD